jgi:hypothetical protein
MAFAKSYVGDTVALATIMQTINSKNSLIPGVTVKSELAGLVQANVAEYYYNLAPAVETATAGDDFNTAAVGNKKAVMTLEAALHMDEKIPYVSLETVKAEQLFDTIAKGAVAMSNVLGSKFVVALEGLAQERTFPLAGDFFDAIVDGIATFSAASSVKIGGAGDTSYSNTVNGVQPTTILVGNLGRGKLYKNDAFQRTINATGQIRVIGEILGLTVVYVQDLVADFVLLNGEGVAYPYSINTLRVVESENFNGVRVQGEIAYPTTGYAILPIDSYALKFTQLLA